jgi:hypothetical protein
MGRWCAGSWDRVAPRDHAFAMTPEVFRRLKPETQRLYEERTPPIVYVPGKPANI